MPIKPRALIIRHAAHGDMCIASAIPPYLKKDGYEVHFLTSKIGMEILKYDPNIDHLIHYCANSVPIEKLHDFYNAISADYDKSIVLTGSIEESMLFPFPSEGWYKTNRQRRMVCTDNYYERGIRLAGYEPNGLLTGQLFFSPEDIAFANNFRAKYKDNFVIVWATSGSSLHKAYAYMHQVAMRVLAEIPESIIVVCGSFDDMILSFKHPRVISFGHYRYPIMRSFALAKIADLVIGPETALLNAAGCFDTPKICMLSHSGKHNLTSTWANDYSIQSQTHCSPCHRLQKVVEIWKRECPLDKYYFHKHRAEIPACAGEGFPPGMVFERIAEVYRNHFQKG